MAAHNLEMDSARVRSGARTRSSSNEAHSHRMSRTQGVRASAVSSRLGLSRLRCDDIYRSYCVPGALVGLGHVEVQGVGGTWPRQDHCVARGNTSCRQCLCVDTSFFVSAASTYLISIFFVLFLHIRYVVPFASSQRSAHRQMVIFAIHCFHTTCSPINMQRIMAVNHCIEKGARSGGLTPHSRSPSCREGLSLALLPEPFVTTHALCPTHGRHTAG